MIKETSTGGREGAGGGGTGMEEKVLNTIEKKKGR